MGEFVENLPFEEYFKREGVNASAICQGVRSMLHMNHYISGGDEDSKSKAAGRVGHLALLEPHTFKDRVSIVPKEVLGKSGSRNTNAYKAWAAEQGGQEIITEEESDEFALMAKTVWKKPEIADTLKESKKEISLFWNGPYKQAKARLDLYKPDEFIADIKFTNRIDKSTFTNTAGRLGYHIKAGWYTEGIERLTSRRLPFYMIVIESKPPFDSFVDEYDSVAVGVGRDRAMEIALRYRQCEKNGYFPGVQEGIGTLYLPKWMVQDALRDIPDEAMEATDL